MTGSMADGGCQVTVCDEGLDLVRRLYSMQRNVCGAEIPLVVQTVIMVSVSGFAAQVVKTHKGQLYLVTPRPEGLLQLI